MDSPFHVGERAIQARLGVEAQLAQQGRRAIQDYLTEQQRQFFSQLPYLFVGSLDAAKRPWASMLIAPPGFMVAPDDRRLQISAQPMVGDPLGNHLDQGMEIGLLGIELHTRRRNRLNGWVSDLKCDRFEVQVRQSFGNCLQYIQARQFSLRQPDQIAVPCVSSLETFGPTEQALITSADTFFIATAYQDETAGAARGIDLSHRGGNPGFVRMDDDRTLTIPDFAGNLYFNTFGNLELNPLAGLFFVDFIQGDRLYLTGWAEVIWSGAEISAYAGAERLLRFHLDSGYRVTGNLPLYWSEPIFSHYLDRTGPW